MSSIIRKLEEAVHPERRDHNTTSGTQPNPYTGKDDYATAPIPPLRPHAPVPADIDAPTGTAPTETTTGPHRHDVLNKLDPSVDSRQGAPVAHHPASAGPLSSTGADTGLRTGAGTLPHTGEGDHRRQTVPVTGANLPGPAPHTAGPHKHDFANKLDPSVDSKTGVSTGNPHGHAGPAAAGVAAGAAPHQAGPRHHEPLADTGVLPGPAPNTAGPHRYDSLNKLDPSVDSGVGPGHTAPGQTAATHATGHHATGHHTGGSTAPIAGTGHHTTHTAGHGHTAPVGGVAAPVGTHEPHHHSKLTKADPALGGHGGAVHATATHSAATGPAPNTAGPHRSDLMNELDPRVDAHPETVHSSTHRGI